MHIETGFLNLEKYIQCVSTPVCVYIYIYMVDKVYQINCHLFLQVCGTEL